ncbi:hypothetical protein QFZ36_000502 [Pseudarthrobacter siccitolerans]|uniref:Phage head-tail adaptor n=1 Tax=Pseudarthrobacter siccitolerans TaxID=861266 RepID=A0ABU0PG75_9MICC|nr:hypothetical protein [Pseudarthrobacter siccitolerans]MDQ0672941.1 hypothetical protein [Pseudarthrobacter siccitolerans]
MFTPLLTQSVTVSRPTATTGIKKTYQDVGSAVPCFIRPFDDSVAGQGGGGAYSKAFRCYTDISADILEGDRLTDENGTIYFVRGIRRNNVGNFPHLKLTLADDKRV